MERRNFMRAAVFGTSGFFITPSGLFTNENSRCIAYTQRSGGDNHGTVINLGDRREIFVDYHLIDRLTGTSLVMQRPVDQGPVLFFDDPWEGPFAFLGAIIKDKDTYRMYYRGWPDPPYSDTSESIFCCYAQSKDGIHWEKPNLKIHTYKGSFDNNIITTHGINYVSPFLDANPNAVPDERYKGICVGGTNPYDLALFASISPDGIHWRRLEEPVFTKGVFDGSNLAFWSESEKQYVCYFRTWSEGNFAEYKGFRTVGRTTSADFFNNWSEPVQMTFGDTHMEVLLQSWPFSCGGKDLDDFFRYSIRGLKHML